MKKIERKELMAEVYLIAPIDKIHNNDEGITPFIRCECRYSHHEIQNDKLVLSIPKLKKVFMEAVGEKL